MLKSRIGTHNASIITLYLDAVGVTRVEDVASRWRWDVFRCVCISLKMRLSGSCHPAGCVHVLESRHNLPTATLLAAKVTVLENPPLFRSLPK
jgi:hypothetical protein